MIYLTQRTKRHIVKSLSASSSPATYIGHFGVFKTKGTDNTHLSNPRGVVKDTSNNIYVCDFSNQRIIKLSSGLAYISEYSTRSTIGSPCAILFDTDLYIVGVYNNAFVRIERLTTAFASVRVSGNLNSTGSLWFRPTGICKGFAAGSFIVSGSALNLFQTIETSSFSAFTTIAVVGETTTWPKLFTTTTYNSIIKHSNGDLYVNNGKQILRINLQGSDFVNIGDSNVVAKTITGLKESLDGSLLIYLNDNQKLVRYDEHLYFIADIYWTTGATVQLDAYDIADFIEV